MAVYTTQKSQTYGTVIGQGGSRDVITDVVSIACTTAMIDNTNDSIELLWLPKGAVVVGAMISASDMDTNASPTLAFDVGDAGDQDRLIAASQVGRAGTLSITLAPTGHGYRYTTATKIVAYVQTAAATAAAGTLTFTIMYFVDENFSATNAVVS